jgi:hypothetical protein
MHSIEILARLAGDNTWEEKCVLLTMSKNSSEDIQEAFKELGDLSHK